jgi:hypothetical protein
MYASELRTCGLGAVVAVLLDAGVGVGWYYFADSASGRAVAAVTTPLAQQDTPNSPLAGPPPREGPAPDVPRLPVLSRPKNQPDTAQAKDAQRVTHPHAPAVPNTCHVATDLMAATG